MFIVSRAMRIIFLGSGDFGCSGLRSLHECGHELLQVVTQPARQSGRGRKVKPTAIAALAVELKLPCIETENVNEAGIVTKIRTLEPDVLLVIAFGQKIGNELLQLPNCRVINLHGSLLPKYRGAAPINWAIINGETETGLTVIELNEQWDAGDILGQVKTKIQPTEIAGELHDRLAQMGPQLLSEVLEKMAAGRDAPLVQDNRLASRAPKLKKEDGAIYWSQPAEALRNFIHGMSPWPGAFCCLKQLDKDKSERVTLIRAEVASTTDSVEVAESTAAGTVDRDLSIHCTTGRLRLLEVKPDNGRLMSFLDFANGRHLQKGDRFL
jgi:methionyl-tRNA formyltransferase